MVVTASLKKVDCTLERHGSAILDIFNEAIVTSTALYDYVPRAAATMGPWFANKRAGNFPVLGLEDARGELLGFASYGAFRHFPAYKYTVEHSVYVRHDARRRGLGGALLAWVIEVAAERDVHVLVGAIDAQNAASIALHEKHGFTHAGTVQQCGFKLGRWLDLALYQRVLATPAHPIDG